MAKERTGSGAPPETVISIIGPGMHVVGECTTDGTLRIEGSVQGSVRAGKAVVVGKDGAVEGDVITQDAVISGRVSGTLVAESRLELQATCRIDGEVRARRMQLEEGAILNGIVQMGENLQPLERVPVATPAKAAAGPPSVPTAMQTSSMAGARPYQPAGFSDSRNG
jgi:cytoskeletal protein CcmA (bactofilin family)